MAASPSPPPPPLQQNIFSPNNSQFSRLQSLNISRILTTKIQCSNQTIQIDTQKLPKKKRKPRPSFAQLVQEKWSVKPNFVAQRFPWEKGPEEDLQEKDEGSESRIDDPVSDSVGFDYEYSSKFPPWPQDNKPRKPDLERNSSAEKGPVSESRIADSVSDSVGFDYECRAKFPPWVQDSKPRKPNLGRDPIAGKGHVSESRIGNSVVSNSVSVDYESRSKFPPLVQGNKPNKRNSERNSSGQEIQEGERSSSRIDDVSVVSDSVSLGRVDLPTWDQETQPESSIEEKDGKNKHLFAAELTESRTSEPTVVNDSVNLSGENVVNSTSWVGSEHQNANFEEEIDGEEKIEASFWEEQEDMLMEMEEAALSSGKSLRTDVGGFSEKKESMRLPWESESKVRNADGDGFNKSNTAMAEKLIPEHELKRLRNMSSRMVERFKVGKAGITQALVEAIHDKWKVVEVVKLKFEAPLAMNMKRTHEMLENRTGGLVILRSGSSIVLFRGMAYKLRCVQSFTKQRTVDINVPLPSKDLDTRQVEQDVAAGIGTSADHSGKILMDLSEEELANLNELNLLLDGLGPRFKDWCGREPLPVDADLLPSVVPGYKRPFRLLPNGIKPGLWDDIMTSYRRAARKMPPHFALGRNKELQGLAAAMVKLWERSAIAKIAIKRGVNNTSNERMAEELKKLTGGTLVSRNKDYIVFYRGNDFLPPEVTKTLTEANERAAICQDEEDEARQKAAALLVSDSKSIKGPLIAGTLAETMAATSRWGSQPSDEEREKMMRDSALARHASLVKFLENKLALAKEKINKAEKALRKVQDYLEPANLPTDLETITDEERFLFRKMGLSMKPFLLLGRRGVFDGTIENMHLHWKFRELVKIIVQGKRFPLVKHIAVSLEAESGGILVSVDKTTKGYAIIVYRGKNYHRPRRIRPKNLLTKRQALARSIELQRREGLKHYIKELQEKIEKLKTELNEMSDVKEIDEATLYSRLDDDSGGEEDDGNNMEEDEEAYLEVYDSGDEDDNT